MTIRKRKENHKHEKSDTNQVLTDQRNKFRTLVNYNKAYIFPYEDALLDTYSTLMSDIERMKAHNPVPREILAESEEELAELKKTMKEAGIQLFS